MHEAYSHTYLHYLTFSWPNDHLDITNNNEAKGLILIITNIELDYFECLL